MAAIYNSKYYHFFFPEVLSDFVHFQRKIQILPPFAFIKSPAAVLYCNGLHIYRKIYFTDIFYSH